MLHTAGCSVVVALVLLVSAPGLAIASGQNDAPTDRWDAEQVTAGDHDDIPRLEPVPLKSGEDLRVVATTNIIGDVVRNVVGETATITVLIGDGQNPHGYAPTPQAVAAIERAHVVFVNGFGLEEGLLDTVESVTSGYVVPVSAGIEPTDDDHDDGPDDGPDDDHDSDNDDDHGHAAGDPHAWFDPNNVIIWTENIAEVMSELLPESGENLSRAAGVYTDQLRRLDADIRRRVETLPEERRKLITDHASLNYFAHEYGFEVIGTVIPSTTDQAEPSAQAISRLVEVIRRENVPAIFVGATAGRGLQNLVNAVAEEVGREIRVGTLLTGSLTTDGGHGDSYLAYMEYNVTQIVENLAD